MKKDSRKKERNEMIKVLFFARLQDEAGTEALEAQKAGQTVQEIKAWLKEEYQLSSLDQAMAAVNEEFADNEDTLSDGDTIAFIPPVSGG